MGMFFNILSTILLHECFIKEACKFHLIFDPKIHITLRIIKVKKEHNLL